MIANPIVPGQSYRVRIGQVVTTVEAPNGIAAMFIAMEKIAAHTAGLSHVAH